MPVPLTTWLARRWIEKIAWISAISAPASIATRQPSTHEPSTSAPQMPK